MYINMLRQQAYMQHVLHAGNQQERRTHDPDIRRKETVQQEPLQLSG
jgi:hypothetical protein